MPHRKRTLDRMCREMIERGNERQLTVMIERNFLDIYALDKETKEPFHTLITEERFPTLAPKVQERVRSDEQKAAEERRLLEEEQKKEQERQALNERLSTKARVLNGKLNLRVITPIQPLSKMYQFVLNCLKVKKR